MADNLTKEQRHKNMINIRSKDTSIEIILRKVLYNYGFRYLKNVNSMIGKPDIVIPKYRAVIFIHGCFWHRHENCKYASTPKSRIDFWEHKFQMTQSRDKKEQFILKEAGWNVIIVWECEIKNNIEETMKKIISEIISYPH